MLVFKKELASYLLTRDASAANRSKQSLFHDKT